MAEFRNKEELIRAARSLNDLLMKQWKEKQIDAAIHEHADLSADMERPDFWDDADRARQDSIKKSSLEQKVTPWKEIRQEVEDFPELIDLTIEEYGNEKEAVQSLEADYQAIKKKFEDLLMVDALNGDDDSRNAIVNINSGAGGTESQDWADMLLRMYTRWFDNRGFRVELVDHQPGEEAGIKSATLIVRGDHAFGYLKSENGVHRLVRISPFDSNKRRHTSFASVHITPEVDDNIDIEVDEKDLRIDTYRSSGAGGQHVNKTDSAVRLTHIPTGVVVACQNERSQHKNKATAMKMMKARLYEIEREKMMDDIESRSGEKREVAWGSQIRSYVFHPYKMVKDLRTDFETSNVDGVMDGDLDGFVNTYLKSLVGLAPRKDGGAPSED